MSERLLNTRNLVKIAILSAIAFALMFFEFPLPFIAPPFYQIDFSEIPVLIGGFAISPGAAVVIELIKNILNVLFEGTDTAFVGELSNFIVGVAFTLPACLIYARHKTKKRALIGLLVGVLTMALVGFIANLYFVIPAYVQFMGLSMETIVSMAQVIFTFVDTPFLLVLCCTTPFNLIKGLLISIIVILIYKHISPLLKA